MSCGIMQPRLEVYTVGKVTFGGVSCFGARCKGLRCAAAGCHRAPSLPCSSRDILHLQPL